MAGDVGTWMSTIGLDYLPAALSRAGFSHFSMTIHFSICICRIEHFVFFCAHSCHEYHVGALAKPLKCCRVRSDTLAFTVLFAGSFTKPMGN